jgi:hypothetical protein
MVQFYDAPNIIWPKYNIDPFVAQRSVNFSFAFTTVNEIQRGNISIHFPAHFIHDVQSPPRLLLNCAKLCSEHVLRFTSQSSPNGLDHFHLSIPSEVQSIPAKSEVNISFFNTVIGPSDNYGALHNISITATNHAIPSDTIPAPMVAPNCVFPSNLIIAPQYRQSGQTEVPITLSFVSQSDLPSGSSITVSFPPRLFADGPKKMPASSILMLGKSTTATVTTVRSVLESRSFSSFVIAISGVRVPKLTFVSLSLDGMTIGNPTQNVPGGIRITTSADTVSCIGVDTGVIDEQPAAPPFVNPDGKNPCDCKTANLTIPFNNVVYAGSAQTSSSGWQIFNATQVDTCEFSKENVAAFTMLFTVPSTGFFKLEALIYGISAATNSSWSFIVRTIDSGKGFGCCGSTAFCGSLTSRKPVFIYPRLFLKAGDTISIIWTVETIGNIAPFADILFVIESIQEPFVYVDAAKGLSGNQGTFDAPVASFQEGLHVLANLVAKLAMKRNVTATMFVRPSSYTENRPHTPQLPTGFSIPDQLKNVALVISSVIVQRATSIYTALQEQRYCNYLVNNCTSQSRFFEASVGTAMDTEITANKSVFGRAFTLKDVTSLTLQGFTIQNFVNRGDGGAFHLENSTLILENCVLKGNSAISYGNGGAIFATKKSTVIIENSIFLGHQARGSGGVIYANDGSLLLLQGSILQGTLSRCFFMTVSFVDV